ncbi:MAG: DNA alkylation repair protein [Thermoplasmatota archaeon]
MESDVVMKRLEEMGDERARKVWARLGMDAKRYFGVNLTKLKKFSREIGKDHALASKLWDSGIHDAQLLACYVEEPKRVTEEQIDSWMDDVDFMDLSDKFATEVVWNTPFAKGKMESWAAHEKEFHKRAGYVLLGKFAQKGRDSDISERELMGYLDRIEKELQGERNWVREVMNYALIHIGSRSENLNERGIEVARNVGKVEVDYGQAKCRIPDAFEDLSRIRLKLI